MPTINPAKSVETPADFLDDDVPGENFPSLMDMPMMIPPQRQQSRSSSRGGSAPAMPPVNQLVPPASTGSATSLLGLPAAVMASQDNAMSPFASGDEGLSFSNVVKLFVTRQKPDWGNPWLTSGISDTTGSGVVIQTEKGRFILTAAHIVADQTFLQVQRSGNEDANKYIASLYAISHDCDLALLQVADDHTEFWGNLKPAPLAEIPALRSVVLVAGFPVGGEQLSITEGVVSRIEGQRYSHSFRELLAVTVDAAINSGNSGGPVFNIHGELVGIAFQVFFGASSNGHVIPPPVVRHFLDGVTKFGPEGYRGIPSLGLEVQELTNGNLRKHFGLDKSVQGVLITKVYGSTCEGLIEENDVLTHVSGYPVANNETVIYKGCGRVKAPIVFQMNHCGDEVPLTIIREGKEMVVNVVAKPDHSLVARSASDQWPVYFIYCGIVFQRLSMKFIDTQTPGFPHYERLVNNDKLMSKDWKEVCIISRVLSDEVNVGYGNERLEQIKKINGKNVPDFASLVEMIQSTDSSYINLTTCCNETIILPSPVNPEANQANKRIMEHYHIAVDRRL